MSKEANAAGFVGRMAVTVHRAYNLTDRQLVGKQDPYIKLECGNEKFHTHTMNGAGTEATWEQAFIFNLKGKEDMFHIHCMDKEVLSDRSIGRVDLRIHDVCLTKGKKSYELSDKDSFTKKTGNVDITFHFEGNIPPQYAAAASATSASSTSTAAAATKPAAALPVASSPPPTSQQYPPPQSYAPSPYPAAPAPAPYYPAAPQPYAQPYPAQQPYPQQPYASPPAAAVYSPPPNYPQQPAYAAYPAQVAYVQPPIAYVQHHHHHQQQQQHPPASYAPPPNVDWACSGCTFWNRGADYRCAMCQRPR